MSGAQVSRYRQREVGYDAGDELNRLVNIVLAIFGAVGSDLGTNFESLSACVGAVIPRQAAADNFPGSFSVFRRCLRSRIRKSFRGSRLAVFERSRPPRLPP